MDKYVGKSVYNGIAIGKIRVYKKTKLSINQDKIEDTQFEKKRFETAREEAQMQLENLYDQAIEEVGEESAAIFRAHALLLEDRDYLNSVNNMIESQNINSEYAVFLTGENFMSIFLDMEDVYMRERAADLADVTERLIRILTKSPKKFVLTEPALILADDLSPSETMQMDKQNILALVTRYGSVHSHTAILARMMNIPGLVDINLKDIIGLDGTTGIVDGEKGVLLVNPDGETLREYELDLQEEENKKVELKSLIGKETITLDGTRLKLYANIGSLSDLQLVKYNDADGIGLFRSEFLYMEKDTYPTQEEQFQVYKQVVKAMEGKKVIIRTFDIGADKQAAYFNLDKEDNPAMGYRAIRICLDRTDLFKTQISALLRASVYGNLAVMYPMVISVEEVKRIKEIVKEVKEELSGKNIPIGHIEQGIMIETPAAAIISDLLAQEVDFFSIGTNDLTQFTLAIDRQNQKLDQLYNPYHEAILRMIQMVVDNGHENGIHVGICGELGADISMIERFLKMGVDELSVSPSFILAIREKVGKLNLSNLSKNVNR